MYQTLKPNQRFRHSLTTTEIDGIQVTIKENGLVTLSRDAGGLVAGLGEIDEIEDIKAGTLIKIVQMLRATRRIVTIPDEESK